MNIEINATLAIQAINFFIAYLLFRFILLRPAYAAIQEDEESRTALEQLVADDKRFIEDRRQMVVDQWKESYAFFKKYLPKSIDRTMLFKEIMSQMQLKEQYLDPVALQSMQDRISHAIVEAVGIHDDHF